MFLDSTRASFFLQSLLSTSISKKTAKKKKKKAGKAVLESADNVVDNEAED